LIRPAKTWTLATLSTLNSVGWNATLPFVGVYLAVSRGTPLWLIGVSYFATGVIALVSQMLGGRLIDRFGPRRVMLAGYVTSIAFALSLGYFIAVRADPIAIAALYPVSALARGISQPAPGAIMASSDTGNLMSGFSFLTIGSNLGFAIGPTIGGILAEYYGYPYVFYFTAFVFVVETGVAIGFIGGGPLYEGVAGGQPGRTARWLDLKRDRKVILLLGVAFVGFLVSGYDIQPLSLYAATFLRMPNDRIGYLFATNGLGVVLLQIPTIRIVEKLKLALLPLILAMFVAVFGFLLASLASDFIQLEVVMIILTVVEMLLSVPLQTIIALYSTPETRGAYQGYYSAIMNGGRSMAAFVGPLSFSLLIFQPRLGWYVISLVAILVAFGFILLSPKIQGQYEISKAARAESTRVIHTTRRED